MSNFGFPTFRNRENSAFARLSSALAWTRRTVDTVGRCGGCASTRGTRLVRRPRGARRRVGRRGGGGARGGKPPVSSRRPRGQKAREIRARRLRWRRRPRCRAGGQPGRDGVRRARPRARALAPVQVDARAASVSPTTRRPSSSRRRRRASAATTSAGRPRALSARTGPCRCPRRCRSCTRSSARARSGRAQGRAGRERGGDSVRRRLRAAGSALARGRDAPGKVETKVETNPRGDQDLELQDLETAKFVTLGFRPDLAFLGLLCAGPACPRDARLGEMLRAVAPDAIADSQIPALEVGLSSLSTELVESTALALSARLARARVAATGRSCARRCRAGRTRPAAAAVGAPPVAAVVRAAGALAPAADRERRRGTRDPGTRAVRSDPAASRDAAAPASPSGAERDGADVLRESAAHHRAGGRP